MADEKKYDEKDEKELEKHDEKVGENDKLGTITWAFILIWAGIVFLATNMGWFDQLGITIDQSWMFRSLEGRNTFGVWNLIALGAGAIILLEAIVRLLLPTYRRHIGGTLIVAAVLIGLGLGSWFSWRDLWPLILIAVGIHVLLTGLGRSKK